MNDTPRTDAEAYEPNCGGEWVVGISFARQLERELAASTAERDDALTMLGIYKLGSDAQKQELANLRARLESDAAIADWKRKHGKA